MNSYSSLRPLQYEVGPVVCGDRGGCATSRQTIPGRHRRRRQRPATPLDRRFFGILLTRVDGRSILSWGKVSKTLRFGLYVFRIRDIFIRILRSVHWIPDPDPAFLVSGFEEANKNKFFF